jgi:hypothetical protein
MRYSSPRSAYNPPCRLLFDPSGRNDFMSHERIENAIEVLLEGFEELQEEIEEKVLGRIVEEGDPGPPPSEEQLDKMDDEFFTQVQTAVGQVIEKQRCEAGDLLAMISVLAEALEELAPDLFEDEEVES